MLTTVNVDMDVTQCIPDGAADVERLPRRSLQL
jgi:hypothetical protein